MNEQEVLHKHLIDSLNGKLSHITFEKVVEDFPEAAMNQKVEGVSYSAWQLLEHMRIAQWDILDFIHNANYQEIPWSIGYWPAEEEKGNNEKWQQSVQDFLRDRDELAKLVTDESVDLFAPITHAPSYTIFREIIVVANHNSYHVGQLLLLRKALNI